MEGPLVSDTTEVLSGAAPAPEEPPIGHPAADPAGAAPRSSSRSGGGDLSKLLVSDLQRIAQELGISGTGRMRKGDLVAAIQERTGGGRSTARSASQSATRGTSAGADAPRPLNQDAMEADTSVRSGIGEAAHAATRRAAASAMRRSAPVIPAWVRQRTATTVTVAPSRRRPPLSRTPERRAAVGRRPPRRAPSPRATSPRARTAAGTATATGAATTRVATDATSAASARTAGRTVSPPRRATAGTRPERPGR